MSEKTAPKKRILVCWNKCDEEKLRQFLHLFFHQRDVDFDIVISEDVFDSKIKDEQELCRCFDAIVVLCELKWGNQYADYWGLELVKQKIRFKRKINLPVLFVSFQKRANIFNGSPSREIINTFGLGHAFIQLPLATLDEINAFYDMPKLTKLEMLDILHFCSLKGMLESIRHDLNEDNIKASKEKIRELLTVSRSDIALTNQLDQCNEVNTLRAFCNNQKMIGTLYSFDNQNRKKDEMIDKKKNTDTKKYHVLLLDDECTENDLNKIKEIANNKGFEIVLAPFKNPQEALNELKREQNKYSVLICDYRLKNEDGVLYYPQGYSFISEASKLGCYGFIVFSNLPRSFRIAVAEKLSSYIENIDRTLMMSEIGQPVFVDKIIEMAELYESKMNEKISTDETCQRFYKYIRTHKLPELNNVNSEEYISIRATCIIQNFVSHLIDQDGQLKNDLLFIGDENKNQYISQWENTRKMFPLTGKFSTNKKETEPADRELFIGRLIIRRFAIYLYYSFDKKIQLPSNLDLSIKDCIDLFLNYAYIPLPKDAKKRDFHYKEKRWSKKRSSKEVVNIIDNDSKPAAICSNSLWLKLSEFSKCPLSYLTVEEEHFFKAHHFPLYQLMKEQSDLGMI